MLVKKRINRVNHEHGRSINLSFDCFIDIYTCVRWTTNIDKRITKVIVCIIETF